MDYQLGNVRGWDEPITHINHKFSTIEIHRDTADFADLQISGSQSLENFGAHVKRKVLSGIQWRRFSAGIYAGCFRHTNRETRCCPPFIECS